MKIYVPSHEWKHSLFVLYNIKIDDCHLINLKIIDNTILIAPFQIKGQLSGLLHAELYHCTVLFNDDVTCVEWSIYFISRDPAIK